MTRAHATNIPPLQQFVRTLRQDLDAVDAAVTEPWRNGPVAAKINRLKALRRRTSATTRPVYRWPHRAHYALDQG
jgi:transposase